jgi:hypothetical protein
MNIDCFIDTVGKLAQSFLKQSAYYAMCQRLNAVVQINVSMVGLRLRNIVTDEQLILSVAEIYSKVSIAYVNFVNFIAFN